ncbi:unnamed protein product [Urochloa humidicola]
MQPEKRSSAAFACDGRGRRAGRRAPHAEPLSASHRPSPPSPPSPSSATPSMEKGVRRGRIAPGGRRRASRGGGPTWGALLLLDLRLTATNRRPGGGAARGSGGAGDGRRLPFFHLHLLSSPSSVPPARRHHPPPRPAPPGRRGRTASALIASSPELPSRSGGRYRPLLLLLRRRYWPRLGGWPPAPHLARARIGGRGTRFGAAEGSHPCSSAAIPCSAIIRVDPGKKRMAVEGDEAMDATARPAAVAPGRRGRIRPAAPAPPPRRARKLLDGKTEEKGREERERAGREMGGGIEKSGRGFRIGWWLVWSNM